jgi:hypothetical protein
MKVIGYTCAGSDQQDLQRAGVFDQLHNSLGDSPVEEIYTMHLGVGIK